MFAVATLTVLTKIINVSFGFQDDCAKEEDKALLLLGAPNCHSHLCFDPSHCLCNLVGISSSFH